MKILLTLLTLISLSVNAQVKLPAKIEAESYSSFKLAEVNTDTVTNNSGGKYITMATNAWCSYYVNVPTTGNYLISLRVADGSGGAISQFKKSDGTLLSQFSTPKTGGLNVWKTIKDTINFTAGKQTFRLFSFFGEYNIDWMQIEPITTPVVPVVNGVITRSTVDSILNALKVIKATFDSSNIKLSSKDFKINQAGEVETKKTDTLMLVPYKK